MALTLPDSSFRSIMEQWVEASRLRLAGDQYSSPVGSADVLVEELNRLQDDLRAATAERGNLQAAVARLDLSLAAAQADLAEQHHRHDAALSRVATEVETAKTTAAMMTTEVEAAKTAAARMAAEVEAATTAAARMATEVEAAKTAAARMATEVEAANTAAARMAAEVEAAKAAAAMMAIEVEAAKAAAAVMAAEVEAAKTAAAMMALEVDAAKAAAAALAPASPPPAALNSTPPSDRPVAPPRRFDEQWYLAYYPDVREAVRRGMFASGEEHYERHGRAERRQAHYVQE